MPQFGKSNGSREIVNGALSSNASAPSVCPATTCTRTVVKRRYNSHSQRPLPPVRGGKTCVRRRIVTRRSEIGNSSEEGSLARSGPPTRKPLDSVAQSQNNGRAAGGTTL